MTQSPPDPRTIRLADYQPFAFLLPQVALTFRLAPQATRVLARLEFTPNPARPGRHDLRLHGEALRLISAAVDGRRITVRSGASSVMGAPRLRLHGFTR